MSSPNDPDRLRVQEDALTVARRAHVRALERAMRLILAGYEARDLIEQAERALKDGEHHKVEKFLFNAGKTLSTNGARSGGDGWPMGARIDGEIGQQMLRPEVHRFVGMWHPPVAPESPQERGSSAIVCTCLEELTDAVHVQQHWEAGCFDLPEFETVPDLPQDCRDLIKSIERDE